MDINGAYVIASGTQQDLDAHFQSPSSPHIDAQSPSDGKLKSFSGGFQQKHSIRNDTDPNGITPELGPMLVLQAVAQTALLMIFSPAKGWVVAVMIQRNPICKKEGDLGTIEQFRRTPLV